MRFSREPNPGRNPLRPTSKGKPNRCKTLFFALASLLVLLKPWKLNHVSKEHGELMCCVWWGGPPNMIHKKNPSRQCGIQNWATVGWQAIVPQPDQRVCCGEFHSLRSLLDDDDHEINGMSHNADIKCHLVQMQFSWWALEVTPGVGFWRDCWKVSSKIFWKYLKVYKKLLNVNNLNAITYKLTAAVHCLECPAIG